MHISATSKGQDDAAERGGGAGRANQKSQSSRGRLWAKEGKNIWRTRIIIAGSERSIGDWDTPEEAAEAYDAVAISLKDGRVPNFSHSEEELRHWRSSDPEAVMAHFKEKARQRHVQNAYDPSSGKYKGISPLSRNSNGEKTYKVRVTINGRECALGEWNTPEGAARAHDAVAINQQDGRAFNFSYGQAEIQRLRSLDTDALVLDLRRQARQSRISKDSAESGRMKGVFSRGEKGEGPSTARISIGNVDTKVGSWATQEEAAKAYDHVAMSLADARPVNFSYSQEKVGRLEASDPHDVVAGLRKEAAKRSLQSKSTASGKLKGAYPQRRDPDGEGPWATRIKMNGHNVAVGDWQTEEAAARAYDHVAISLQTRRALNFEYDKQTMERLRSMPPEEVVAELRKEASQRLIQQEISCGKGTVWLGPTQKWHARLKHGKKDWSLGAWIRRDQAAEAYDQMAIRIGGKIMNDPDRYTADQIADIKALSQDDLACRLQAEAKKANDSASN
ncbi:hypothetical protein WJX74_000274 [Apatococcus lobatus]|uniref:AP2/ERF domain-containing protein n=1 Tax=Apatococcus lobatus TaxID=904363 RepID=A0AAW1QAZ5_9CHLO